MKELGWEGVGMGRIWVGKELGWEGMWFGKFEKKLR